MRICKRSGSGVPVSEMILGQNIEMYAGLQGSTPTGGFSTISGTVDGEVLEMPPLSIVRVRIA